MVEGQKSERDFPDRGKACLQMRNRGGWHANLKTQEREECLGRLEGLKSRVHTKGLVLIGRQNTERMGVNYGKNVDTQ